MIKTAGVTLIEMSEEIEKVFKDREDIPLFYIESGSRLWGIASPDSDFDVRGVHLQSKQQYFDFKKHRDVIEIMDGDFDFVSYDIDKTFGLLSKSNPTVFEWVRAHIVYYNNLPDWASLQKKIIENFDFKALYHHYISLADSNIESMVSDKKFTYKTVFYCIRGLLSADLATRCVVPELQIDDLFKQFKIDNIVLTIAKDTLEHKKQQTEKEEVKREEKGKMLKDILFFRNELDGRNIVKTNNGKQLDRALRDYALDLKSKYY